MATWAESFRDEIERDIRSRTEERREFLRALQALVYNPTKDGKPRARFNENFALRGLGTRYTTRWGNSYPFVTVDPDYRNGSSSGISISIAHLDEEQAAAAGIGGPFKGGEWRFYLPRYTESTREIPESTTPEQLVSLVHGELIPGLSREIRKMESDLGLVPEFIKESIELSRQFRALCKKYAGTELEYKPHRLRERLEYLAE